MRPDPIQADYLIRTTREPIFRIFLDRGNEPLESSQLRLALEAHGFKAEHPNHWGLLFMAMVNSKVLEIVGRESAAAASRNDAKNCTYRVTTDAWAYIINILAPAREWPRPRMTVEKPKVEQTPLAV